MEYFEEIREKIKRLLAVDIITSLSNEQIDQELDIILREVYSAGYDWARDTVSDWDEQEGILM